MNFFRLIFFNRLKCFCQEVDSFTEFVPSHSHPHNTHRSTHRAYSTAHRKITVYESSKRGFLTGFCSQQISLLATCLQLLQNTSLKYALIFFKAHDRQLCFGLQHHFFLNTTITENLHFEPCLSLFIIHHSLVSITQSMVIV